MHIFVVGLNHRSAPVELRERLAFQHAQLPAAFAKLRETVGLREAAIVSTCNRVEVYGRVDALDGVTERLERFFSEHGQMALEQLRPRLYAYAEPESVHHLFTVASGLDSMVLGEDEILRQIKAAYEHARTQGATGKTFHALFQRALNAAKAVRAKTAIGKGHTSIGAVAVQLAEKIFADLTRATVVLIGAGKIGEATLKRLALRGVKAVRVMNRSWEQAVSVAQPYHALPVPFERLAAQLRDADIVMTSTSASTCLLSRELVTSAMRQRHQRPLCLIDLGVPRNIDPGVGAVDHVYLFNVDDLQGLVEHSQRQRLQALGPAHAILEYKVNQFLTWWREEAAGCAIDSSSEVVAAR